MEVVKIEDNPDGSATIEFDVTEEEEILLIQYALTKMIAKRVEKGPKETNGSL